MELDLEAKGLISVSGVNSALDKSTPQRGSFSGFLSKRNLLELDLGKKPTYLVCIDYSPYVGAKIRELGLRPKDCTLVRMEPSVVLPSNFAPSRRRQFGKVITVGGKPEADSFSVNWPLVYPSGIQRKQLQATERSERVVVINGNKMSFVKGELYSLRRLAIREIANLDLYGTQWNSVLWNRMFIAARSLAHAVLSLKFPRWSGISRWFQSYPNSMGPVDDKLATMSMYKYALVIENSAEYMSEKLMEALFAGCIPIYVGPNPEEFGIPKDLVIWTGPNMTAIRDSLEKASTWDLERFHSRLTTFLDSPEVRDLWDHEMVYQRMLEIIQGKTR